ncbi:MAG: hypothetical protein O7E57_17530 [Gammaproteobacteria bacterium]|nr:hypothetical protein [Gammaproteobacteria bacterium]
MYGRMQLADFLVSRALQINNECLQLLSGLEGELKVQDVRLLTTNTRQLLSFWQMLRWSVGRAPYRDAVKRLQLVGLELPMLDSPFARVASRLLVKTRDAGSSRAICGARDVLVGETARGLDPEQVERLACVFQDESTCWRDYSVLRQIGDDELIVSGIVRAYVQGRRRCVRLVADPGAEDGVFNKPGKLKSGLAWVRHAVNHLELLMPALSDGNKTRLRYLRKFSRNLVKQIELDEFTIAVAELEMKAGWSRRIIRAADEHKHRILKGRRKLFPRCYGAKKREFLNSITEDVHNLGLQEVVLLPVEKVRSGEFV